MWIWRSFYPRENGDSDHESDSLGLMLASLDVFFNGSSWYFAQFWNIALEVFFSNTPALFLKQTLEKEIPDESGFLLRISYITYFLTRVNINISDILRETLMRGVLRISVVLVNTACISLRITFERLDKGYRQSHMQPAPCFFVQAKLHASTGGWEGNDVR